MSLFRAAVLAMGAVALGLAWRMSAVETGAAPPTPGIIQLTDDPSINVRPSWSPDNRMIAFQSNRASSTYHIFVMNADGSGQRQLTQGPRDDRHPVWMPDGKSILFDSDDGKAEEIWLVNVADGSEHQVTHLGAEANFAGPSPDGQRISFFFFKDQVLDLWTARIDGSDARPLTTDMASAQNNQCTFACHQAAWSADGQTLAFTQGSRDSIWTIHSDGSDARQIVSNNDLNHFPWFMPDGRLGYVAEHVSPIQSWTDAWLYDLNTGSAPTLLQGQMSPQGPFEWSSDYKKVLFHSPRSGSFEIYLVDLSLPDGIAALQGKSVPTGHAPSTPDTSTTGNSAPATVQSNVSATLGIAAAFGLFAIAGVLGLAVWRNRMH
jgi:dipeptidyl aminopeptidase/acylaminoacyl peptidase